MKETKEYNEHYLKYRETILKNAKEYQNKKTLDKKIIREKKKANDELKIKLFDMLIKEVLN